MSQLFLSTLEPHDFSEWSSETDPGTYRETSATAALTGSYGLLWTGGASDSSERLQGSISTPSDTVVYFSFRFNKNTLSTAFGGQQTNDWFRIQDSVGTSLLRMDLYENSGDFHIEVVVPNDVSNDTLVTGTLGAGALYIQVVIHQATNSSSSDGSAAIYINNVLQDSVSNVDNYDQFLQAIHDIAFNPQGSDLTGTAYIDDVEVRDDASLLATNEFYALGMCADPTNLYVTGLKDDGTLSLYRYNISSLAEDGTATFGSATTSDITGGSINLIPVWRVGSDKALYLYGRDGNNVQLQKNTTGGTGTWTDIGAGTATWTTTKIAIAALPYALNPDDIIVAFKDDDIYRTTDNGVSWTKQGDALQGLVAGGRHAIRDNWVLLAGTAAGSILYSNNAGVSTQPSGSTIITGTVKRIAFDYAS